MMVNFESSVVISLSLLKEFVYEAKRRAFAASDKKMTLPDQTSVYSYRPFDDRRYAGMIYADMYRGNTIEGGHESVTIDLVLRWRNQYYGGTKADFWDVGAGPRVSAIEPTLVAAGARFPEVVTAFLRQSLMSVPPDFPVRGPHQFRATDVEFRGDQFRGEWEYTNNWQGVPLFQTDDPFASYTGEERITLNGVEVFWHAYHGGLVRDKFFPLLVQT